MKQHSTKTVPPDRLLDEIAILVQRNSELEQQNNATTSERDVLKQKLAEASRLLKASTTGLISVDKSGLINDVNACAAEILGADKAYLVRKPISLFIAPEDQALFYINRSRVASGTLPQPFDIKFKQKNGEIRSARVTASQVTDVGLNSGGMLLATEDITPFRLALDKLQYKEYFIDLLFSIFTDLSVCSRADIDEMIVYALEKLVLITGAHRVYVGLFHDNSAQFTITHEWRAKGIKPPAQTLKRKDTKSIAGIIGQIKKGRTLAIADIAARASNAVDAQMGFHVPGTRAFLISPLFYGRNLVGMIGCDTVKKVDTWSRDMRQLVKAVGGIIVNALVRNQIEKKPAVIRDAILQFIPPGSDSGGNTLADAQRTAEAVSTPAPTASGKKADWQFKEGECDDPALLTTARLRNDQIATITCSNCTRKKKLDISQIRAIGTRLKATCICGSEKYVRIELRREQRKTVNLEGFFIFGPGDRSARQPNDWGRIEINNISHHGIGIRLLENIDVRVEDRFRVKFALDNTAHSIIQKEVVVRSVDGPAVGCEFVDPDPSDATIGFYLIT